MKPKAVRILVVVAVLMMVSTFISPSLAESVVVPFTGGTTAASTTLSYSGNVWIIVSGTGTVGLSPSPQNDAFYVYTDPNGAAITPFYPDPITVFDSGILCINGLPAQNSIPDWAVAPTYSEIHEYAFLASVPSGPISFGALDTGVVTDNTGSYTVTVAIAAVAKITPTTLNLQSNGRWITARVTLPSGIDASQVIQSSILLGGVVPVADKPYTARGSRLQMKFDRCAVQELLAVGDNVVTISGQLVDGSDFIATATIRGMNPSKGKGKGKVK